MRSVVRTDGLALPGPASLAGWTVEVPLLLEALGPGERSDRPFLRSEPSAPGARRLVLGEGTDRCTLDLPIASPEITPAGGGVTPVGERAALLHAPFDRAALRALRAQRPELLVLGNARTLWSDGARLVDAVRALRTEVGAEPLLWTPRVALPHRLPILAYLGVDVVDTTEGELRAASGEFLDPSLGPRPPGEPREPRGCDCPACLRAPPGGPVEHAREVYRRGAREAAAAARRGALRALVESRLPAEPAMAELLRYADRDLYDLLEARAPVLGGGTVPYVLAESLRRPEMRRFRDRLVERYRPPPSKSVLVLVPCSRTKPYRLSPSHRRFASAWSDRRAPERLHVVSVSSPIGVVPRELEDLPPARNYDVPVTGDWSAEEREIVLRGLRHLLASGRYRRAVVHLDPEEYRFLDEPLAASGLEVTRSATDGRTTAPEAIARLREAVAEALEGLPSGPGGPLAVVTEELRELASVQFGREAAERLFAAPLRLMGRPWFQRISDGRHDLGSVREERGLFHLTVAGAQRLGDRLARVDVEPSLSLEGDLFAPGVLGADPAIRVGDAVGLFRSGTLAAVGEAALPGPLLGELRRGLGVRVRHRVPPAADTAKTEELPSSAGR